MGNKTRCSRYYKKGPEIRHNKGIFRLTNELANLVKNEGLNIIAQVDSYADGLKYFASEEH